MDALELEENWKRACRNDELLRRFGEPLADMKLIEGVLNRVQGLAQPPGPVLRGLAVGFASSDWEVNGEARYLQLATLVVEATKAPNADLASAINVLRDLGHASMTLLLHAWRGEAEVDDLTQLGNRRSMEALLYRLEQSATPFQYASIDVDGLKAVNDGAGHPAGDQLLKDVAEHLRQIIPQGAIAFRYGGDEYGVLFQMADPHAQTLSDALLSAEALIPAGISYSWGTGSWPDDDPDAHTVISAADRSMNDKKQRKKAVATGSVAVTLRLVPVSPHSPYAKRK